MEGLSNRPPNMGHKQNKMAGLKALKQSLKLVVVVKI